MGTLLTSIVAPDHDRAAGAPAGAPAAPCVEAVGRRWLGIVATSALLLAAGCDALARPLDESLLRPPAVQRWSPADAGLAFETISFSSRSGTSLTGWFIPSRTPSGDPARRAVVVCGSGTTDMSRDARWFGMLHAAGWSTLVFDYQGFGASAGTPSIDAVCGDAIGALHAVRRRPEIDPDRVAMLGVGVGALGALGAAADAARHDRPVPALVLEQCFDPAELAIELGANTLKFPLLAGLAGLAVRVGGLPSDLLPVPNAMACESAILLLNGTTPETPPPDTALRVWRVASSRSALWFMAGAGAAPDGLARYGATYDRAITGFLRSVEEGTFDPPGIEWRTPFFGAPRVEVTFAPEEVGRPVQLTYVSEVLETGRPYDAVDWSSPPRLEFAWLVAPESPVELPAVHRPYTVVPWVWPVEVPPETRRTDASGVTWWGPPEPALRVAGDGMSASGSNEPPRATDADSTPGAATDG